MDTASLRAGRRRGHAAWRPATAAASNHGTVTRPRRGAGGSAAGASRPGRRRQQRRGGHVGPGRRLAPDDCCFRRRGHGCWARPEARRRGVPFTGTAWSWSVCPGCRSLHLVDQQPGLVRERRGQCAEIRNVERALERTGREDIRVVSSRERTSRGHRGGISRRRRRGGRRAARAALPDSRGSMHGPG